MKTAIAFVLGVALALAAPAVALPAIPHIIVAAGTVSAAASVGVTSLQFLNDGTFATPVLVNLNGATRVRQIVVSADGNTIAVDGTVIGSPPAVATAWAAEQPVFAAKMQAMFANTAVQTFLTGP